MLRGTLTFVVSMELRGGTMVKLIGRWGNGWLWLATRYDDGGPCHGGREEWVERFAAVSIGRFTSQGMTNQIEQNEEVQQEWGGRRWRQMRITRGFGWGWWGGWCGEKWTSSSCSSRCCSCWCGYVWWTRKTWTCPFRCQKTVPRPPHPPRVPLVWTERHFLVGKMMNPPHRMTMNRRGGRRRRRQRRRLEVSSLLSVWTPLSCPKGAAPRYRMETLPTRTTLMGVMMNLRESELLKWSQSLRRSTLRSPRTRGSCQPAMEGEKYGGREDANTPPKMII